MREKTIFPSPPGSGCLGAALAGLVVVVLAAFGVKKAVRR